MNLLKPFNKRRLAVAALASLLAMGCGSSSPSAVDTGIAKDSLRIALELWKSGASLIDVKSGSPPIFMGDSDWRDGATLLDYQILDSDKEDGGNLHCPVRLRICGRTGKQEEKQVVYTITTRPRITIFPEE